MAAAVRLLNWTYSVEHENKVHRSTSYLMKRRGTDWLRDSPSPNGSTLLELDVFRGTVGNIVNSRMEGRLCIHRPY